MPFVEVPQLLVFDQIKAHFFLQVSMEQLVQDIFEPAFMQNSLKTCCLAVDS